ncbi:MAG: hypothetical protein K2X76_10555, partial [Sphingomonas sp.]|nr:hypothetical protein [Sphingomonas sp.]
MTELLAVAVRLKADGSGLVGQVRQSKEALDELKRTTSQAGSAAEAMAADFTRASASTGRATVATLELAVAQGKAKQASDELARAQQAMSAAAAASAAQQELAAKTIEVAEFRVERAKAAVAKAANASADEQARAAERLIAAETRLAGAQQRAAEGAASTAKAQEQAASILAAAQLRQAQSQQRLIKAQEESERAASGATRSLGAQRAGYAQLGFQIQDITQSIALGTNAFTILAQQGGQTASAVSQLGLTGVGGRVAAFLAGPWGAAILAGTAVLGPFIGKLFEAGDAADKAAGKTLTLADALDRERIATDRAREALRAYNDEAARKRGSDSLSTGLNLAKARTDLSNVNAQLGSIAPYNDGSNPEITRRFKELQTRQRELQQTVRNLLIDKAVSDAAAAADSRAGTNRRFDNRRDALIREAAGDDRLAELLGPQLAAIERARADANKRPKSAAGLQRFGASADTRLDLFTNRYSDVPAVAREATQSLIQLDALADQIEKRRPPNYAALKKQIDDARAAIVGGRDRGLADAIERVADGFDQSGAAAKRASQGTKQLDDIVRYLSANLDKNPGFKPLIDQADRAKAAIEASLLKPYQDVIDAQNEQRQVNQLLLDGHEDEAQALQTILGLRRANIALTKDQALAILEGVRAQRQQQRELEALQRRQQTQLAFLGDVRGSITRAFAGESTDIAGDIVRAFRRAFAEQLTERLFGNLFQGLTDKILGRAEIEEPSQRFKDAVDKTLDPLDRFAAAVDRAGTAAGAGAPAGGNGLVDDGKRFPLPDILGRSSGNWLLDLLGLGKKRPRFGTTYDGEEVVVTGSRSKTGVDSVELLLKELLVKGFKIDAASVNKLGDLIGAGLKGAGTGLAIAGIGQSLGIKLDSGGAAIGGAAGGLLGKLFPKIPGLDIVGGLVGGLFGSLFSSAPRAKSGAITSVDGKVEISGNNGDAKNSVAQAVSQVQAGLQQIADQLGADIGNFNVSIAKYKDSFRVDPTGSGSDGGKYGDRYVQGIGKFDNNDIQGAVSFAIADAIKDGAIKGISPAVAKALQSSTDVNKALREALKVRDLETFIGGPAAALKKTFDDFDRLAAERVELAKKYSLDLVELEKKTGEARAKLIADTLQANTGELQSLLDSIKFGDLFEGTAAEKRRQLGAEIDKAQADQAAGVEGAGAKLAQLYQQL